MTAWETALAIWRAADQACRPLDDMWGNAEHGSPVYVAVNELHSAAVRNECQAFDVVMAIPAINLGMVATKIALLAESDRIENDCSDDARLIFADVQRLAAEEAGRIPA